MSRIWMPEMPQVKFGKKNHFEGWYFKVVDSAEENAIAVIPGVSFGKTKDESHSFVQILDGRNSQSYYFQFPVNDFTSLSDKFAITIKENHFSLEGIALSLEDSNSSVTGKLTFGEAIPWPVTRLSPGAMGPFRFIPRMQCLHGILGFDHEIQGKLTIDGRVVDFSHGRGYIEKDWGREFPSAWIWMQTNHFEETGVSFTASIANIPFAGRSFPGYLIGFLYNGTIYRFTTYTRANLSPPKVSDSSVSFVVQNKKNMIEVEAIRAKGASLRSPVDGLMTGRILESLDSSVNLRFYELRKNEKKLLFEGTGRNAGLEVVGNPKEIGAEMP